MPKPKPVLNWYPAVVGQWNGKVYLLSLSVSKVKTKYKTELVREKDGDKNRDLVDIGAAAHIRVLASAPPTNTIPAGSIIIILIDALYPSNQGKLAEVATPLQITNFGSTKEITPGIDPAKLSPLKLWQTSCLITQILIAQSLPSKVNASKKSKSKKSKPPMSSSKN